MIHKHSLILFTFLLVISCQNTAQTSETSLNSDPNETIYQEKIDSLQIVEVELTKQMVTYKAIGKAEENIDSISDLIWTIHNLTQQYEMKLKGEFPLIMQTQANNCGPTCIKMISDFYGVNKELSVYNDLAKLDSNGTTIDNMVNAGRQLNFSSDKHIISYNQLLNLNAFPLIVHWNSNHFVVVHKANDSTVWVADPILGHKKYTRSEFCKHWVHLDGPAIGLGKAITFRPNASFYTP